MAVFNFWARLNEPSRKNNNWFNRMGVARTFFNKFAEPGSLSNCLSYRIAIALMTIDANRAAIKMNRSVAANGFAEGFGLDGKDALRANDDMIEVEVLG